MELPVDDDDDDDDGDDGEALQLVELPVLPVHGDGDDDLSVNISNYF